MTRAHDRQKTLPTPASGGARRACRSPAPRARSAPPSAATSPSPSPSPPPARGRAAPRCSPGTSPLPGLAPGQARSAGCQHRADEVTLHLLMHAWVARAVCLPAVLVGSSVRAFAMYSPFTRRARSATGALLTPCAGAAARAVPRGTARWPLRASSPVKAHSYPHGRKIEHSLRTMRW